MGRGRMGVVYEAIQLNAGERRVALKVLSWRTELDISRFEQEVQMHAKIRHPHVVQIYESGEDQGYYFFSMELLTGGTLDGHISDLQRDQRKAVAILEKVSRAVAHIHTYGIIHRDLKTSNILFDADGEPRVTDFGVARLLNSDCRLTCTGLAVGTPLYMAPEHFKEDSTPTTISDVWSLGVVLYRLLCGSYPFEAKTQEALILSILTQEPRSLRDSVDSELRAICEKCLEKNSQRRYQTPNDLAEDCRRWLAGEVIVARPVNAMIRTGKWIRRNKVKTAVATAVLAPLCVAVFYILFVNYLRGSHPVHYFDKQGGLALETEDFNLGKNKRITESFDAGPFRGGAKLTLFVEGVPDDLRNKLSFVLRSDWAGLPDPKVVGPLKHKQAVRIFRPTGKLLSDSCFYFTKESWPASFRNKVPPGLSLRVQVSAE